MNHKENRLDPISTALAAAAVKEAAGPVANFFKSIGLDAYNKIVVTFEKCFQGHVEDTKKRCSTVKNILYRDESVDFLSQYVNIKFSSGRGHNSVSDLNAVSLALSGTRTLICGTAGAGKTMFMRWTALRIIDGMKVHGRIPLFLEMRFFEEEYHKSPLERYIYDKTSSVEDAASFEQFALGLKLGHFVVLLDAIDEINPHYREKVVKRVLDFMRHYPECGIIVSSRFDQQLQSIQEFSVLRTTPMDKTQIIEVISKLEYADEVKEKLIDRLNGGLYEELNEFLSNPLLATIMLLSFDHSGDIPTKLTSFYQQAFEALYQRHDSAKGAYKRDLHAGMQIDQFERVFSTFSFQTYLNYKFEFSDVELLSAFREACEYNAVTADPGLIVRDAMESVCVIQREGLDHVFSHRSFQEYFCALFISKYREEDVAKLVDAVGKMEHRSNVLKMLYELSPEIVEYEWMLPLVRTYLAEVGKVRTSTKSGLQRIFKATFGTLIVGLSENTVSFVGFGSEYENEWDYSGRWMSVLQTATDGKMSLFGRVFANPLWNNFYEFRDSLPHGLGPEDSQIVNNGNGERPINVDQVEIHLYPSDAKWLIYSNLPEIFDNIRIASKSLQEDIIKRRSSRRSAVRELLNKPKRRSRRSSK